MRVGAVQFFKNIIGSTRENFGEILAVFRRKYEKTLIDGNSETQIPETRLQSSKSKFGRISR